MSIYAVLHGECDPWPSKAEMMKVLAAGGLRIMEGQYSIWVRDCERFSFVTYGGDICEPTISAEADSVDVMIRDAGLVSDALAKAGIRHRFEIYDASDDEDFVETLFAYKHYGWPQEA
jgi:hypothetical protein